MADSGQCGCKDRLVSFAEAKESENKSTSLSKTRRIRAGEHAPKMSRRVVAKCRVAVFGVAVVSSADQEWSRTSHV